MILQPKSKPNGKSNIAQAIGPWDFWFRLWEGGEAAGGLVGRSLLTPQ